MLIALLVVLSVLLVAAVAFIFWLFGVLKNTLDIADRVMDTAQGRIAPKMKEAYNGKYYPATVVAQVQFESPQDAKIVDWSLYESKKIVGFIIMTTDKMADFYGVDFVNSINEDLLEELMEPVVIKNAVVYEPFEGEWQWKSA